MMNTLMGLIRVKMNLYRAGASHCEALGDTRFAKPQLPKLFLKDFCSTELLLRGPRQLPRFPYPYAGPECVVLFVIYVLAFMVIRNLLNNNFQGVQSNTSCIGVKEPIFCLSTCEINYRALNFQLRKL